MEEKLVGREWVYRPAFHVFNVIAVGDEAATPTIPIMGAEEIVMCAVAVRPGILKNMAVKRKYFDAWNKVPTLLYIDDLLYAENHGRIIGVYRVTDTTSDEAQVTPLNFSDLTPLPEAGFCVKRKLGESGCFEGVGCQLQYASTAKIEALRFETSLERLKTTVNELCKHVDEKAKGYTPEKAAIIEEFTNLVTKLTTQIDKLNDQEK